MEKIFNTIGSVISNLDFSTPSWDLFVILFFVVGAVLYGFSLGRERIIGFMVSIYISIAVITVFPFTEQAAEATFGNITVFRIIAFLGIFLILFIIFEQSGLFHGATTSGISRSIFLTVILSVLHVGLLISIILYMLPQEVLNNFSVSVQEVFVSPGWRFAWVIAPIIAMALISKRE